jgi:hypothetical protein
MNAWLITWEGTDKSIKEANKIAGVLSGRCSSSYVENLVDFIYHRTIFDVHAMVHYANKRKAREAKSKMLFSTNGRIYYGSNPCLYARRVKNIEVNVDELKNIEIVNWVEHARIENNESTGYKFKEIEPEKRKRVSRPKYAPLTIEPTNA